MSNIHVAIENAVGTITIDRRQRFNALDVETARDLRRAGLQLARDNNVRAVVLQGSGGVFCSGADLKYIRDGGDEEDLAYLKVHPERSEGSTEPTRGPRRPSELEQREGSVDPSLRSGLTEKYGDVFKQILEYIHSTISEIRRAPKPFIAAVDGIAAAGGFGLAMSCDLVIASPAATFEWAYAKTGLTGAESSTFILPRLVGLRRAFEMLFLNPRIDAQRALEIGLITMVAPMSDVPAIAQRLAAGPTEAYGIAKDLMNQAAGFDRLDYHLDRELASLARIANGADFAEGLKAFFEKRPPEFAGR